MASSLAMRSKSSSRDLDIPGIALEVVGGGGPLAIFDIWSLQYFSKSEFTLSEGFGCKLRNVPRPGLLLRLGLRLDLGGGW